MLIRPDGEYETDEEDEKNHGEELEVEEVRETLGLVAVTRKALNTQAKNGDDANGRIFSMCDARWRIKFAV